MASGATTLPHRSVATIRSSQAPGSTPHTPSHPIASQYGSPSAIRADDDVVIIELGMRNIRVGFAGDSIPKATLQCGPEGQRRAGDFRAWQGSGRHGRGWAKEHELWDFDLRSMDLGLFQDELERLLRDAFSQYLLIDSRPRRLGLVLDSSVPVPLLSAVLDTMFDKFQTPTVSLFSSSVMASVAAGVRSALIVDMGWSDTVVTSIYEYRQVKKTSSIRAGRLLHEALYGLLKSAIVADVTEDGGPGISFQECEDLMCRLMWCRPSAARSSQRNSAQLETVEEQDETEADTPEIPFRNVKVTLSSASPPTTIDFDLENTAQACEAVFFASYAPTATDDHDSLLPNLVYEHLLRLPLDVRAVCMSRVIFSGGCSNILGIKERVIDEVKAIIDKRGWEPVTGKGVDAYMHNHKLVRTNSSRPGPETSSPSSESPETEKLQGPGHEAHEKDAIEIKIGKQKRATKQTQGEIRALHSLGPWTGASLTCQLKVPATAIVDRDVWLQQGANGASRPSDVDLKAQQRQSMTTGGYVRGSGGHYGNWTLGVWGYLS